MMLGEGPTDSLPASTLDDLFGRAAARQPDAVALIDPPNRETFTDGAPRRVTYAEADRILTAIAARLRDLGLPTDAIIGIQLPNTVEHVLTILGVLRAGMIAAPLPLLWRRAEVSSALARIGARAIVTTARIGSFAACEMTMQVAADVFHIRHVIGCGRGLPDGVTQFDDLIDDATSAWALPWDLPAVAPTERDGNSAAHVALVTFDVTPDGIVAVARNHAELIAGGVACRSEDGTTAETNILTSIALGSFGGLSLAMLPWLLRGGALSLHHGFDAEVFARQCRDDHCTTAVVPGQLVPQLAEAALLAQPDLTNVVAAWRAPERHLASPRWLHPHAALTDVLMFGEMALIGSRRATDGLPVPLPASAEGARTQAGTLSLRGAMVPRHAFPPGASSVPRLCADAGGFVDTGYPCRIDPEGMLTLTGPPSGMFSVGSYRFVTSDVQNLVGGLHDRAFIMALPDALAGHRLASVSGDADVAAALAELGVNPLIADAFPSPDR
jgi:acyl-CoA synthetase (AMP-forming)/AMP-acid ligase II